MTVPTTNRVTTTTLAKALNTGLRAAMEDDPKVIVMGEDVGKLGGVFRVTDGLQKDFGDHRVLDTPLAESGIIGTAVGLAMRGYRPVTEIQFDGFVFPGFDQIISQVVCRQASLRNELVHLFRVGPVSLAAEPFPLTNHKCSASVIFTVGNALTLSIAVKFPSMEGAFDSPIHHLPIT